MHGELAIFECPECALSKKADGIVRRWKRNGFSDNGLQFRHWIGGASCAVAPRDACAFAVDRFGLAIFLRPSDRRKRFEGLALRREPFWVLGDELRPIAGKLHISLSGSQRKCTARSTSPPWATTGRLTFDSQLLTLRQEHQDYVIVHELFHFHAPNHGKLCKSLIRAHLGKFENLEAELRRLASIPFN